MECGQLHEVLPRRVPRWLALVLLLASVGFIADARTEFHVADSSEFARLAPGGLIRSEPIDGAPAGAAAYRVLYRSSGLHDEPIAVSGVVIVPAGRPALSGRRVVAWAHPTTGVVSRCAPSLARVLFASIQGLQEMLDNGYVVAATDYPGLGTPGPHPYLVGVSEGRAVLDCVRAATLVPGSGTGRTFAVWGHSQGGQAALFTGMLAAKYAPELHLAGVAAAAPATELATLLKEDIDSSGGRNLTAMTLWSWSRVFNAPMLEVVTPEAVPVIDQLANDCIERFFDVFIRRGPTRALDRSFLKVANFSDTEPWRSLLARNTPGMLPRAMPVFLAQGTADELVRPAVTRDYAARLCRNGNAVQLYWMQGVGHAFAARRSATAAVRWMGDRFAGKPAPNNCGAER